MFNDEPSGTRARYRAAPPASSAAETGRMFGCLTGCLIWNVVAGFLMWLISQGQAGGSDGLLGSIGAFVKLGLMSGLVFLAALVSRIVQQLTRPGAKAGAALDASDSATRSPGIQQPAWEQFAKGYWNAVSLDLDDARLASPSPTEEKTIGKVRVRVFTEPEDTWVEARPDPPIPESLVLESQDLWSTVKQSLSRPELRCGDERFDQAIHIEGVEIEAAALLDQACRQGVHDWIRNTGGTVRGGAVRFEQRANTARTTDGFAWLDPVMHQSAKVAVLLSLEPKEIPERLLGNARQDPDPAVRLKNLELLLERVDPAHPATIEAARLAVQRAEGRLRLVGATRLGQEGIPVLRELWSSPGEPEELRSQVLRPLAGLLPVDQAVELLLEALKTPSAALQRAALALADTQAYQLGVPQLVSVLGTAAEPTAVRVAGMLGKRGDPSAEDALLGLLRHASPEVKRAAAAALGWMGTIRAVEALLESSRGTWTDSELKRVALEAVEAIQSRLGDVEAGRLSVAEAPDGGGALTLAEEPGALSVAEGQDLGGGLTPAEEPAAPPGDSPPGAGAASRGA